MTDESTNLWFVELSSPPAAGGTSSTTPAGKDNWRTSAKLKVSVPQRYAFDQFVQWLFHQAEAAT